MPGDVRTPHGWQFLLFFARRCARAHYSLIGARTFETPATFRINLVAKSHMIGQCSGSIRTATQNTSSSPLLINIDNISPIFPPILFHFISFHFISFHFISFHFILFLNPLMVSYFQWTYVLYKLYLKPISNVVCIVKKKTTTKTTTTKRKGKRCHHDHCQFSFIFSVWVRAEHAAHLNRAVLD